MKTLTLLLISFLVQSSAVAVKETKWTASNFKLGHCYQYKINDAAYLECGETEWCILDGEYLADYIVAMTEINVKRIDSLERIIRMLLPPDKVRLKNKTNFNNV